MAELKCPFSNARKVVMIIYFLIIYLCVRLPDLSAETI